MAWISVHGMFVNDLVVRREQGSEWRLMGFGLTLGAGDDLIE